MTTALYRRYRPDTFDQVIGQAHVTDPLRAALRSNRVNHAYLFSGPRGCGKTTSARILARCLNCAQGPTDTPCGKCDSCVELATGGPGSLDVIEIDAASHGGVDDARDLRERATFAPVRDRYKIFIIDEAHMVSPQGFNALLKLVEEPPEHIKFIFATTEPERVIGTIRSRTHHYPFRLVPPDVLGPYLQKICDEESITVSEGVLPLVIRAGGGSVRDSLSVLDQLMAGSVDGHLDYAKTIALLGYTDSALLDQSVDALAGGDGAAIYRVIERMIESGHDPRRFAEDLLQRLRDLLIIAVAGDGAADVLDAIPRDQLERMFVQARNWGPAGLARAADFTDIALRQMTGATSPRLQLELLIGRILVPAEPHVSPSAQSSQQGGTVRGHVQQNSLATSSSVSVEATDTKQAHGVTRKSRKMEKPSAAENPDESPSQSAQQSALHHTRPIEPQQPHSESLPQGQGAYLQKPEQQVRKQRQQSSREEGHPSQSPVQGIVTADVLRGRWDEVINRLATVSRAAWSLVEQNAQLGAVDGNTAVLLFPTRGLANAFHRSNRHIDVEKAIYEATGLTVSVTINVSQAGGGSEVTSPTALASHVDEPSPASQHEQHSSLPEPKSNSRRPTAVASPPVSQPAKRATVPDLTDWGPVAIPGGQVGVEENATSDSHGNTEQKSHSQLNNFASERQTSRSDSRDGHLSRLAEVKPQTAGAITSTQSRVASRQGTESRPTPFAATSSQTYEDSDPAAEPAPDTSNTRIREVEPNSVTKPAPNSVSDDESASMYDADIEVSNTIGVPTVIEILGGTIIEDIEDNKDW